MGEEQRRDSGTLLRVDKSAVVDAPTTLNHQSGGGSADSGSVCSTTHTVVPTGLSVTVAANAQTVGEFMSRHTVVPPRFRPDKAQTLSTVHVAVVGRFDN